MKYEEGGVKFLREKCGEWINTVAMNKPEKLEVRGITRGMSKSAKCIDNIPRKAFRE